MSENNVKGNTENLENEITWYKENIGNFSYKKDGEIKMCVDAIYERRTEKGCIIKGWCFDKSAKNDMLIFIVAKNGDAVCCKNNKIRTDVSAYHKLENMPLYLGFEITTSIPYSQIKYIIAVNKENKKQLSLKKGEFPRETKKLSAAGKVFRTFLVASDKLRTLIKEKRLSLNPEKMKEYMDKVKNIKKETNIFTYEDWLVENEPSKEDFEAQKAYKFARTPKISIITPAYNTPAIFFDELMISLQSQTYPNWELCLADGGSKEETINCFKKWQEKEPRLKVVYLTQNKGIAGNTNAAADLAEGEYIALLDHDDVLPPDALFEMVKAAVEQGGDFIYSDSDNFDEEKRHSPFFKPDFSPDFLRSINYICHFTMMSTQLFNDVGRFRSGFDGSQDHDLFLRATEKAKKIIHIPKILYNWRAHQDSVAANPESKLYAVQAGVKAVQEHLDRVGIKGTVEPAKDILFSYRVKADIIGNPLVSIIIPNKDSLKYLKQCIDSILEKSTYKNYEIIVVENNSETTEIFDYYKEIEQNEKIKVIKWESGFNYSAINNFAAQQAKGEHLLFLNNDTQVITPNWLEEMLMFCQRDDIGAVGAKLLFDDDTIQHAGVVVGIAGIAGHALAGNLNYYPGYFNNLLLARNVSCATAACLMVKSKVFSQVGGFDENFVVALNDVDLCLKIDTAGYLIAQTPYAELYHFESKTRGYEDSPQKVFRYHTEIFRLIDKWEDFMRKGDPFYNPNLSLAGVDYQLKRKTEIDYIDFYKQLKQKYIKEGKLPKE